MITYKNEGVYNAMWNGKKKAITFSYDDAVTQDIRLIEILDKYGIKATFNLNSELLGMDGKLIREGKEINHTKIPASELAKIYKNHEVAAHTLTHPHLPPLPDDEVIRQVERDRLNLSDIVGYEVVGMAYPGGGMNNNDRVARLIKSHTGIKYARTISLGYSFLPQEDLYRYKPTAFHLDFKNNYSLARDFFEREEEGVFYIWGHSYEFDINNTWGEFEDFCKYVSGRDDIFYGTNKEILL